MHCVCDVASVLSELLHEVRLIEVCRLLSLSFCPFFMLGGESPLQGGYSLTFDST